MANICTVTISGSAVNVIEGSLQIKSRVDDKDSATFTVKDDTGTLAFVKGQKVRITDSQLGLLFSGFINKPTATNLYPQPTTLWSMDCVNKFAVVAKKTSSNTSKKKHRGGKHNNQHSGSIAANQIQEYIEPEGVSGNFGLDWSELQTDWQSGTLTNAAGATNTSTGNEGAGDLELAAAGVGMTFMQQSQADFNAGTAGLGLTATTSGVTLTPTQAIALQATCGIPNLSNGAIYVKIWSGSYTIAASDTLYFDVWIASTSPAQKASLELVFTDGTSFQASQATVGVDVQGVGPAISNDLSQLATNTWYNRRFFLDGGGAWVGKTIAYAAVAFGGNSAGQYAAYFRNIYIQNGATTKLTIFSTTATATQTTPQQLQNNGYTGMSCTVVASYAQHGAMYSPAFSLTNVGIVQSSQVSWVLSLPSSDFVFLATASVDGFSTFLPCTSGSAIPDLIAGMNTAGLSLQFVYSMYNNGPDPTLTPVLTSIQGSVISAYSCTKSDIINTTNETTGWSAGTLSNLNTSGANSLQLNGYARSWIDANYANQTLYGASSPAQGVFTKQFYLTSATGADARSRLDFAGSNWQNFTLEMDVVLGAANTQSGFVYRTTGWQNNSNTFAYAFILQTTAATFGYGTNSSSGSGAFTTVHTQAITLSTGTTYHLKAVINGNSHSFYVNDVLLFTSTDATYTAAGYVGLRFENGSGSTQTGYFANFGIVAALSGTWTSPAIDIHSLGTTSNSQIILQIDPATVASIATFAVAISLNNGVTFTSCPNVLPTPVIAGALNGQGYFQSFPVPGLAPGTNVSGYSQVMLQITITASTASTGLFMPDVQAISLFVIGPYSSTGTRSTAPLVWDSMVRTNVASGFGTATSGQSYTQTGTGTPALTNDEAQISNTAGDVHMRIGSGTQQDTMATCRLSLSASTISAGLELRYSDTNNLYRLAISTTTVSIVKVSGGLSILLASINMTIATSVYYRLRFIVQGDGSAAPVSLYGNVWQDQTTEPTTYIISATD